MNNSEFIDVLRECDGYLIPSGDKIKLKEGTKVKITNTEIIGISDKIFQFLSFVFIKF